MKHWIRSNKPFIAFLLCLGLFRTAVAAWNPIPSGSMRPTLLEGDVVFVNRLAYDLKVPLTDIRLVKLGEPQRGDVVTFTSPQDGTRLIKRLVGLPGDVVEMRAERLFINGEAARYEEAQALTEPVAPVGNLPATRITESLAGHERRVQWLDGRGSAANFGPVTVPEGQYLMLGDNRDNSYDSRYIGFVPRERLIGQAIRVLVSADILDRWQPRLARMGLAL